MRVLWLEVVGLDGYCVRLGLRIISEARVTAVWCWMIRS